MEKLVEEMTTVEKKTIAEPETPMEEPVAEESMMEPAEYMTMAWPEGWRVKVELGGREACDGDSGGAGGMENPG